MAKTIFITSFFGLSARNILSTSILDILSKVPDARIVVIAPEAKKEEYQKFFAAGKKNIIIEGVALKNVKVTTFRWETASKSRLERLFFSLFLNASDTQTRRVYRIAALKGRHFGPMYFFDWVLAKCGNLKIFRQVLRYLDHLLSPKDQYAEYFERYSPAMVFSTDIFNEHDVQIMREARARGVKIVGMVRSWDNITSHGLNRIVPDKLIVHTPHIKNEAIKYCDVPENLIFVSGIPHYDRYAPEFRKTREEVFKKLNLDPRKKTVFFAPPSDIYTENNPVSIQVINALRRLKDVQLIIRLYMVGEINLGDIKAAPGEIAIDAPPKHLNFVDADLAPQEDAHLADLIYHSDVVVAVASTLAIDAATMGKPVVFIGFDGADRPYWKSLRRYYDFDHQRYLINTGGVTLAENMDQLVKSVSEYLRDPSLHAAEREKITKDFCWRLDGASGARAGNFLAEELTLSGKNFSISKS